ncbi:MAG: nucleotide exchange factor GrpE [Patescibacteria group bacterium]|nr:nucleotide exchange factor GrpE [Patescibacteria group bacterium]
MKTHEEMEKSKVSEMETNWRRALADYKNLEKRVTEEKTEFAKYALSNFLRELLPILDNLEKAQEHLKDEGLQLVITNFKELLKQEGVETIEAEGDNFDPRHHEAVELAKGEENKILKVLETGYKLRSRILRPAKVIVGKKFASSDSVNNPQETNSN